MPLIHPVILTVCPEAHQPSNLTPVRAWWLFAKTSVADKQRPVSQGSQTHSHCHLRDLYAERSLLTIIFHAYHEAESWHLSHIHLIEETGAQRAAVTNVRLPSKRVGVRTETDP